MFIQHMIVLENRPSERQAELAFLAPLPSGTQVEDFDSDIWTKSGGDSWFFSPTGHGTTSEELLYRMGPLCIDTDDCPVDPKPFLARPSEVSEEEMSYVRESLGVTTPTPKEE